MTATATEPDTDEDTVRRFKWIEDMIIFHRPDWEYLVNHTLPVRPPTEAEAARYAALQESGEWADLYEPAEPPRVAVPPAAPEITALLQGAPEPPAEPEPDSEPPVLDEHTETALERFMQAHDELGEQPDPVLAPDPEDALEVHHDTQVIDMGEESG